MYIEKIELENIGPIEALEYKFSFTAEGNPKPLILVGKNGAGKSIVLSYLINALMTAKQQLYPTSEVEEGRVYKLRSAQYITSGKSYSFAKVVFSQDMQCYEWILSQKKKDFNFTSIRREWESIPEEENTFIHFNFRAENPLLEQLINKSCILYFPANRFEEPAWLNYENLTSKPEYTYQRNMQGVSDRNIICHSPLKTNQNWLFDLILDREIYERNIISTALPIFGPQGPVQTPIQIFAGNSGPSTRIYEEATKLLRIILQAEGNIRFGVGKRQNRTLSVMKNDSASLVNQIFQLSTGQTALLNLFLSIMRDYDLSHSPIDTIANISGIVLVDEIDLHLHAVHQYEILPQLIAMFPKVQFIVTTHSPLFLLGLEKTLGQDKFDIVELPKGEKISAEIFSEFEDAYKTFLETEKFQNSIKDAVTASTKPVVFLEGSLDIRYLTKAAELLGQGELLSKIELKDGEGFGGLNGVWKSRKYIQHFSRNKVVLLYDCDQTINNEQEDGFYRRVIPYLGDNPVKKGIENLFPAATIRKVIAYRTETIDVVQEHRKTVRGTAEVIPEVMSVNKDEKANVCTWLCANGDRGDFLGFLEIFNALSTILADNP